MQVVNQRPRVSFFWWLLAASTGFCADRETQVVTHPRSQLPHWGYARNFARHQPQNSLLLIWAWQVAPAQLSRQWILVRLSAECEPTGSVLRAEATDLECVKDASRTTLHSSQKLPSNQMARRRVASPIRDVAPPRWYQTTCYHFNIFQQQSAWVLLGAHEIQECFHVLGQLSSTVTAVLYNMWQVSNTFAWGRSI